ncbi:MAG: YARHG domain-containing protein [Hyphomicrobiaceae bacterium]
MFSKYPETVILAVVAVILFLIGSFSGARADCFEGIGCTDSEYFARYELRKLSCQNLWYVRNRIYDENGYCFKTRRARKQFSNAGCLYWNQGAVPLNAYERANVLSIRAIERKKGCG